MELIKLSNNKWKVIIEEKGSMECDSIEKAAEMLEICGVNDIAIDEAICHIHALGHKKACFGVNGTFMFSVEK